MTLTISAPERLQEICQAARNDLGFNFLVDITSIDNYEDAPRFTVVYHLYGWSIGVTCASKYPSGRKLLNSRQ